MVCLFMHMRIILYSITVFLAIILFTLYPASAQTSIPGWIKNNAGWWSEGLIGDDDFVKGIQYLIEKEIMIIPETKAGQGTSEGIPGWVKNNAGWWSEGLIGDSDFVSGIQFLIKESIIRLPESAQTLDEQLDYEITGGSIIDIEPEEDIPSLIIFIDSYSDGKLIIELPRTIIDAKYGCDDDDFFVLVNGVEVDFDEIITSESRLLTIEFPEGTEDIEIIGTPAQPSVFAIIYSFKSGVVGIPIEFSGEGSCFPDGASLKYKWVFSDGFEPSSKIVTRIFKEPGFYLVTLTVTDNQGLSATSTAKIIIIEEGIKFK